MLKKLLIATTLIILVIPDTTAQSWKFLRHELSFGIGASNFLGELGGADRIGSHNIASVRDLEFSMTRPAVAAGYRYRFSPNWSAKANLVYGRLNGDDALTAEPYRNNRNLHFRSPVVELSVQVEWFPLGDNTSFDYRMGGIQGNPSGSISPYLFAGIGGFWFNPKAQYTDGNWYALQPLGTEGQTVPGSGVEPYSRVSVCIPVGFGLKYALDSQWSIGFELTVRTTFTDYIDDVGGVYYDKEAIRAANGDMGDIAAYFADPSKGDIEPIVDGAYYNEVTQPGNQRGNDTENDAYMFAIFSINYKLLQGGRSLPKFR